MDGHVESSDSDVDIDGISGPSEKKLKDISLSPPSTATTASVPGEPISKTVSNIAASSLLGSIATMIDSGGESPAGKLGGMNLLQTSSSAESSVASSLPPASSGIGVTASGSGVTGAIPTTPLLMNGNVLTSGNSLMSNILTVPQQTVTPAPTASPVTITVRTPPGTGALSQSLISSIVNTPEVQALLSKNPGQPITILRVPDAPNQPGVTTTPVKAPKQKQKAPVQSKNPVTTLATSQSVTTPLPITTAKLSSRLFSNKTDADASKSTKTDSKSSVTAKAAKGSSPKPAETTQSKKKSGRVGKPGKGMAPAVPSSQDLEKLRKLQKLNKLPESKTRSGRVSRPPLFRIKEYKTMTVKEIADKSGSSDEEFTDSDDQSVDHDMTMTGKKKNFKCENCEKCYIGRRGLARHYRDNPKHGDVDALLADEEKEESKEEEDNDEEQMQDMDVGQEKGVDESTRRDKLQSSDKKILKSSPQKSILPESSSPRTRSQSAAPTAGAVGKGRGRERQSKSTSAESSDVDGRGDGYSISDSEGKGTSHSTQKAKLGLNYRYFDPKSPLDEDLVKVILPLLTKIVSPWEYIMAHARQTSPPDQSLVKGLISALEVLQTEAKKTVHACLLRVPGVRSRSPRSKTSPTKASPTKPSSTSPSLSITNGDVARYLGVDVGEYNVKEPKEEELPEWCRFLNKGGVSSSVATSSTPSSSTATTLSSTTTTSSSSSTTASAASTTSTASTNDKVQLQTSTYVVPDNMQVQTKPTETVKDALLKKRKMETLASQESPTKKTKVSTPSRSSLIKLKTTSSSASSKNSDSIGNIRSIAENIDESNSTPVTTANNKRVIPPLGPISSSKSKVITKPLSTSLPPLKPIKMATTVTKETKEASPKTSEPLSTESKLENKEEAKNNDVKAESAIALSQSDPGAALSLVDETQDVTLGGVTETKDETAGENGSGKEELAGSGEKPVEGGDDMSVQTTTTTTTTLLPEGTTIMQLDDGTFLLQKPDGTAMHVQTPPGMTIETVQALLSMEAGAIETTTDEPQEPAVATEPQTLQPELPQTQYVLEDGSCIQLPEGVTLDMAIEMGLLNQATDG